MTGTMMNLFAPLLALHAAHAVPAAFTRAPAPKASLQWVASDGSLETQSDAGIQTSWSWDDAMPGVSAQIRGGPALRVVIETRHLPRRATLGQAHSESGKVLRLEPVTGKPELRLVLEQYSSAATYDLALHVPGHASPEKLVLVVSVPRVTPVVLMNKNACTDRTYILEPVKDSQARHLFVSLSCFEDFWHYKLYVRKSDDAEWADTRGTHGVKVDTSARYVLYKIEKNADNPEKSDPTISFRTRDVDANQNEYVLRQK